MANTKVVSIVDGLFSFIKLSAQFWLSLRFGLTKAVLGLFRSQLEPVDPDGPAVNYAEQVREQQPTNSQKNLIRLCGLLCIFPIAMTIPAINTMVAAYSAYLFAFIVAAMFFLSLLLYQVLESEFDQVRGKPALLFTLFLFFMVSWVVLQLNLIVFIFFYPAIFAKIFAFFCNRNARSAS